MPYRRIPSLNWLRVFEAAARMESFSGASRISQHEPGSRQPAGSRHLKTILRRSCLSVVPAM